MTDIICKFYQTGFCKYKQNCTNRHEHELCTNIDECKEKGCNKRHPTICKKFRDKGKCRFDIDCAYHHKEEYNSQNKLNEMLSQCMIKHEKEICNVNEELTKLQELVKVLKEKVNNLEQVIEDNT